MGKHLSPKTNKCIKNNLISDKLVTTNMERQPPQQASHIIEPNLNDDKSAATNMERHLHLPSAIDNCNKSDQDDEKSSTTTVKKLKKLKKTKVKKQGPGLRQVSNVDQHQTEDCFDSKTDSKDRNSSLKTTSKTDSKDQNCDLTTTIQTSKTKASIKIDSKDPKTKIQTSETNDSTTNSNEMASSGEKICLWMDQKGQVITKHQFVN